ncbi:MAG: PIN domain-containing protein [Dehalococcoidia bacterium]
MAAPLVDTNILLRHIRGDHDDQSPRATAFLRRVAEGELLVECTETVIFETVFTLQSFYRVARRNIRDAVLPLIRMRALELANKELFDETFVLYIGTSLSFADAYHAVFALRRGTGEVVSFDRGFDRVAGLRRSEP